MMTTDTNDMTSELTVDFNFYLDSSKGLYYPYSCIALINPAEHNSIIYFDDICDTITHETLHHCFFLCGVDDDEKEEILISRIGMVDEYV